MPITHSGYGNEVGAGLKGRAEARLAFGKRGLGTLAFGDVGDERLNDLSPAPFDPRQHDFQRDFSSVWIRGQPVESGAALGHAFANVFARHRIRGLSVRLELR